MPEVNDTMKVEDSGVTITKGTTDGAAPERKQYVIEAENGLFKNGKQYAKGETIALDEKTAANFLALGDIKEA